MDIARRMEKVVLTWPFVLLLFCVTLGSLVGLLSDGKDLRGWLGSVPAAVWVLLVGGLLGQIFLLRQEKRAARHEHAVWLRQQRIEAYGEYLAAQTAIFAAIAEGRQDDRALLLAALIDKQSAVTLRAPSSIGHALDGLHRRTVAAAYGDTQPDARLRRSYEMADISSHALILFRRDLDLYEPSTPETSGSVDSAV